MPITNSLAFLFTVLGEWWAEGKVISRGMSSSTVDRIRKPGHDDTDYASDTWIGMTFVLGGIALCVHSKTS